MGCASQPVAETHGRFKNVDLESAGERHFICTAAAVAAALAAACLLHLLLQLLLLLLHLLLLGVVKRLKRRNYEQTEIYMYIIRHACTETARDREMETDRG